MYKNALRGVATLFGQTAAINTVGGLCKAIVGRIASSNHSGRVRAWAAKHVSTEHFVVCAVAAVVACVVLMAASTTPVHAQTTNTTNTTVGDVTGGPCNGNADLPPPVERLVYLLDRLQLYLLVLGLGLAGVGYSYAGILWIVIGGPEGRRKARNRAVQVTGGLILVILSSGLVVTIQHLLCTG